MKKKLPTILLTITIVSSLVLACMGALELASESARRRASSSFIELKTEAASEKPAVIKSDGTFIQWWLVRDWDDEMWQKEFQILKEAQMEYVILQPLAFYIFDAELQAWVTETVYPSAIEGFRRMEGYGDVVDSCLRNAQKAGLKVFLGLNFSDEWWSRRHDAQWINSRVAEGNLIADELWDSYKGKYPDAFYGWYWCWETDNIYFKRYDNYNSAQILSGAIRLFTRHLENGDRRLPVMLSPYMNWILGTPKGNADLWEYVLANSGLREGDILCPQDSVGAGGLNLKNFARWFSELRKAVDKVPGIKLWADTEVFVSNDWTAVPIDRFIGQMTELAPYVEGFVTFSYSHYYSPNIIEEGFHTAYLRYLESGETEKNPPAAPRNLKFVYDGNGAVILTWYPSTDDSGVCGYYIYRNGKKIANVQVPRTYGAPGQGAATTYTDSQENRPRDPVYEVEAYDFAGNLSERTPKIGFTGD